MQHSTACVCSLISVCVCVRLSYLPAPRWQRNAVTSLLPLPTGMPIHMDATNEMHVVAAVIANSMHACSPLLPCQCLLRITYLLHYRFTRARARRPRSSSMMQSTTAHTHIMHQHLIRWTYLMVDSIGQHLHHISFPVVGRCHRLILKGKLAKPPPLF